MTRDDIIRLARQAGLHYFYDSEGHCGGITTDKIEGDENDVKLVEMLAPFAALVAAAERERMDLNSIHSCHAECDNPFCVRVREAVAHEREACAKIADGELRNQTQLLTNPPKSGAAWTIAAAIRARGENT